MNEQRKSLPTRPIGAAGPVHQHRAVKGRVREQYWPGTVMGLGLFIGLASLFTVAPWTLIDPDLLLRIFLVLCFAGNLLPYIRSGLWLGMERLEWFLFNLLAVGPIGTSLLLWLNFLGHGPATVSEHAVSGTQMGRTVLVYQFTDGHLAEFPHARSVYRDWYPITGDRVRITEATGLFGFPVVLRKEPFASAS